MLDVAFLLSEYGFQTNLDLSCSSGVTRPYEEFFLDLATKKVNFLNEHRSDEMQLRLPGFVTRNDRVMRRRKQMRDYIIRG